MVDEQQHEEQMVVDRAVDEQAVDEQVADQAEVDQVDDEHNDVIAMPIVVVMNTAENHFYLLTSSFLKLKMKKFLCQNTKK